MSKVKEKILAAIENHDFEKVRTVEALRNDLNILIEQGKGNHIVILQKDAEGNGYSPLRMMDPYCHYAPYTTWYGECEEEVSQDNLPCLILVPIN